MPEEVARKKVYSVVIPAWNEERTIKGVIDVFKTHPLCQEVLVISDGSTDKTGDVARAAGARVIELKENRGKGEAMELGVKEAAQDVIFFSDADIEGMTHEIISRMVIPVLDNECSMYIALRARSIYWLNKILHFFPLLGGERVIVRDLWYAVPKRYRTKFKIETALNYYSKKLGKKAKFSLFHGIRQTKKEFKYGFLVGFWLRIKMFAEVLYVSIVLYVFDSFFN